MTNINPRLHRWLALIAAVLCLPALALAADCGCNSALGDTATETAPSCAATMDAGCCTGCCAQGQPSPSSKRPVNGPSLAQGIVGILAGANFTPCSAASLPVRHAVDSQFGVLAVKVSAAKVPTDSAPIIFWSKSLACDGTPPPPESPRTFLRRCRSGSAPPVS